MRGYQQLSRDERVRIAHMVEEGGSLRGMARRLNRAASTIGRELKRNRNADGSYRAVSAHSRARAAPRGRPPGKIRPPSLEEPRGNALFRFVLRHLENDHWSPQLIAGRLKRHRPADAVSHETIYRFIYHPRQRRQRLWQHLAEQRAMRRRRSLRSEVRAQARRGPGIELRPGAANARLQAGHWEADLLCFSKPGAVILHAVERLSRFRFALLLPGKAASELMQQLISAFRHLPSVLHETLTVDNGSEFAQWPMLLTELGMPTYFCAPYCAWQKGTLESLNRMLRRYLPRHTDLEGLDQEDLTDICEELNDRPMAVLAYRTPREMLHSELGLSVALHL
jgi:IS30 family transposase